jgi:hypothetical protein
MGSGGSIAAGPADIIQSEHLEDAFDRNKEQIQSLFFKTTEQSEDGGVLFSKELVYSNYFLFHYLLEDIADERMRQLGELPFLENTTEAIELYCDLLDKPELIYPIEVDADALDAVGVEITSCSCQKYALVAECLGIHDLSFYDATRSIENPFNNQALAVNVSNNQLNNASFEKSQLSQSSSILQLNLGGNSLSHLPKVPSNLLFLDLSYSEELSFESFGMFTVCPQLLRLVLDGCGLTTTVMTEETEGVSCSSIFVGLVKLSDLSLKENMFETVENLKGLEYFSKQSFCLSTEIIKSEETSSATVSLSSVTLCSVNLIDNPVSESTAERKKLTEFLSLSIPSISVINGKPVMHSGDGVAVINKASLAYKNRNAVVSDMDMITETMAQEFEAAMKGEKDTTVVS